jgi:hypothetical protein
MLKALNLGIERPKRLKKSENSATLLVGKPLYPNRITEHAYCVISLAALFRASFHNQGDKILQILAADSLLFLSLESPIPEVDIHWAERHLGLQKFEFAGICRARHQLFWTAISTHFHEFWLS